MTFLYIVIAILLIGVLVLVHEVGHYTAARLTGVPVIEFAIGFGKRIWSKKSGKTGIVYSLRLVPVGGFVAFADSNDENGIANYYKTAVWKRLVTTVSGPLMNFALAFLLAVFYLMAIGLPTVLPNVGSVNEGSPAQAAGVQVGDRFLRIRGVDVQGDVEKIRVEINASKGSAFDAVIERDGREIPVVITPVLAGDGENYIIGITIGQQGEPTRYGFFESIKMSFQIMVNAVTMLLQFLVGLVTRGEGGENFASPIGIVDVMVNTAQQNGWQSFVDMAIMLSVNLGLFNLLPLPALDGSKVIFLLIEWVRGKPIPPEKESIVTLIGFGLFILLFIFLAGRDIAKLFGWLQ